MSKQVTIDALRTIATQFNFRIWFLEVVSFLFAGWLASTVFGGVVAYVTHGGFWSLASHSAAVYVVMVLVWGILIGFLSLFGVRDKRKRTLTSWFVALLLGIGAGLALTGFSQGWMGALAATISGVVMLPLLGKLWNFLESTRMTTELGLPAQFLPAARNLPKQTSDRVRAILNQALSDWRNLQDLLSHPNALGRGARIVDVDALRSDADRSIRYLLERAVVVSKLELIASSSREASAVQAADTAVARLSSAADTLHEAVRAASKFAASEDQDEAYLLKARVDGLQEFAAGLQSADQELEQAYAELEEQFGSQGRHTG